MDKTFMIMVGIDFGWKERNIRNVKIWGYLIR